MRVGLAQMNPRVGDFGGNLAKAREMAGRAKVEGADVVVFPEFTLIGYPPKDLLLRGEFVEDSLRALDEFAAGVRGIVVIVGYAEPNVGEFGKPLRNALAVIEDGRVVSRHYKQLLPTYDVFDEARYFEPTPPEGASNIATIGGQRVGITICEDIWCEPAPVGERRLYRHDPVEALVGAGVNWVVNISASPYGIGKGQSRPAMYGRQARRLGCPVVVVNQVGGYEDLVFDGNSCAFDAAGDVIAHCREFEEDMVVVDLASGTGRVETPAEGMASVYKALVFGIREYAAKRGCATAAVESGGGLNAVVVKSLATHALGADCIEGGGELVLACHNKSDMAVGKCSHVGDIAPIADLTQTRVRELALWINAKHHGVIPAALLGEADGRLDRVITAYVEEERGVREIVADGLDEQYVRRVTAEIDAAEGLRRRATVGIKVTRRAFGPGRPMPCVR